MAGGSASTDNFPFCERGRDLLEVLSVRAFVSQAMTSLPIFGSAVEVTNGYKHDWPDKLKYHMT